MGCLFLPDRITKHKIISRMNTKQMLQIYVIGGERTFNKAQENFEKKNKFGD